MVQVKRSKPRCEVEFHTSTAFYSAEGNSNDDPSDDLISTSTSKMLDSPAGTWTTVLTYKNFGTHLAPETWYDRLNPMDLAVIKMGRPPEKLDTVMVGLVDEVRRVRRMGADGKPMRQVIINGRDFGKMLLKAVLQFFPQLANNTLPLAMLTGDNALLALQAFFFSEQFEYGTPAELIYKGITKVLHNLMTFETQTYDPKTKRPSTTTLKEILRFRLCRTNNIQPFIQTLADYEGSLWNFFDGVINKPFFEMFVDTRDGQELQRMVPPSITEHDSAGVGKFEKTWGEDSSKVCLIMRPTPFDKSDWDSLDTHIISDFDVMEEDLGRSDHENQNIWRVQPTVHLLGSDVYDHQVAPQLNLPNIKKHGISFYQPQLQGLAGGKKEEEWADPVKYGDALSKTLKDWYWRNIWFENGSMILHGNGKIKVGQRIHNPDEYHNHIYYIDGVSQEYVNNKSWTTSLQVTRGQDFAGLTAASSPATPTEVKTYGKAQVEAVQPASKKASTSTAPTQTHIVKAKETLTSIAKTYYNKVTPPLIDKIVRANPQIKDPNKIYPGQKFKIPPL